MVGNARSKALCRKSIRKAHKLVKKLLKNQELYNHFAGSGNRVHESYLEGNMDEKQLQNMWDDLNKFCDSFKEAGGKPDGFKEFIMTSIAFDHDLIMDMNKKT